MNKGKGYYLVIAAFFAAVIIIHLISNRIFEKNYHSIFLENASCIIPMRMWEPDVDETYISDHMFKIVDADGEYIIYGSQLEKYNDEDIEKGLLDTNGDVDLLDFESEQQLKELIKSNSSILENITISYEHSRSIFNSYRIEGVAGGELDGYNSYVAVLKQNGMCFIEIILYRDPEYLSEKEKKKIMLSLNWHQNYSSK